MELWIPSPSAPYIFPSVHQGVSDWLGNASAEFYRSRDLNISGEGTPSQCPRDGGNSVSLKCFPSQDHGRDLSLVSDITAVVAYLKKQGGQYL